MTVELIEELGALAGLVEEWDRLAESNGLPLMSPHVVLPWLELLAPRAARPAVVVVRDQGGELAGIAPFFISQPKPRSRWELRLPCADLGAELAPLAVPGRELPLARAVADLSRTLTPHPHLLALEAVPVALPWPTLLRTQLRGSCSCTYLTIPSPVIPLEGDFERWLGGRSPNLRAQIRRSWRRFTARGGSSRTATVETVADDIEAFLKLHGRRWEGRAGSPLLANRDRLRQALLQTAQRLLTSSRSRFRLQLLELDRRPIAAQLFLAAGTEVLYINGGWDPSYAELRPGLLCLIAGIERAFALGDTALNLGAGATPYKLRLASEDRPVSWTVVVPPGPGMVRGMASLAAIAVGQRLRARLPATLTPAQRQRLKRALAIVGR
jgi:CelD/BcsL family acetyltransferase involved in cellulose biosynthesis